MTNPFQIPPCFQRAELQQRQRRRFRNGFFAALAALVTLVTGLLIQGCQSERTATVTPVGNPPDPSGSPASQAPVAEQKPNPSPQLNSDATPVPASPVATAGSAVIASHPEILYPVKSGDTLSRIAKTHGTTVKALKAANRLDSDRLVVGTKLRIPEG